MMLATLSAPRPIVRPRLRKRMMRDIKKLMPSFGIGILATAFLVLLSGWARFLLPRILQ
jgi:hypothetical protein